jgi:hypothetical protein
MMDGAGRHTPDKAGERWLRSVPPPMSTSRCVNTYLTIHCGPPKSEISETFSVF